MEFCKKCGSQIEIVGMDVEGFDVWDCVNGCNEDFENSDDFKEFVEFFI